ncbi:MAG: helix-turn-helix transcriptional regulator [Ruminococcaceae bacterium]|nr:helix-turn-helix transcriptional regulator [Oscillospiraceae bacterium]
MNDQIKDIGMRLASLRDDMEISQQEMAEKLGVDIETYLAYEKGDMDFSFSVIYKAAEVLGVDVLDLISGSAPTISMCCMVKKGKGYSVKREDEYDYKHLAYTFRNKKSEPFLVTITPDDKPPVMHGHEGQEFNYVISGKMMLYIGDISYELSEGDSVYFDSSVPHAEVALGDKEAQFIAVVVK